MTTETVEDVPEVLLLLVRMLVDDSDAVHVEPQVEGNVTVLHVRVAPEDGGILIGGGGKMARALRLVLSAMSKKTGRCYQLAID